jgi:hypothetical protein
MEWGGVDLVDRVALVAGPAGASRAAGVETGAGLQVPTELLVLARPRPAGAHRAETGVGR